MKIDYTARDHVRDVIQSLGRTEDIRFSPSGRRLAVAAFHRNRIAVVDIDVTRVRDTGTVSLTGAVEIASPSLNYPHGLDFIDDETLVVASRMGGLSIFSVPADETARELHELSPVRLARADWAPLLESPGSVVVVRSDQVCELLVCNNSGNSVTRHLVDRGTDCAVTGGEVLLRKWINLPDGIGVSHDRRWIAISNHNTHNVLVYEWSERLGAESKPDGVLRGLYFPHGLRFTADGRHLLVADAGAPFIHVYARGNEGWHGARYPARSIRVMDEALFLRGRGDPQEGGPKGIDIDHGMNILAATSEHQSLLFLDLPAMLRDLPAAPVVESVEYEFGILQQAERLRLKAHDAEARAAKAEHRLLKRKAKWLPKPLRRLYSAWKPAN